MQDVDGQVDPLVRSVAQWFAALAEAKRDCKRVRNRERNLRGRWFKSSPAYQSMGDSVNPTQRMKPKAQSSAEDKPWRLYWRDRLGDPDCPYITRWVLDLGPLGSLRLHHWYGNDDQRALHDHPWGFLTLVVWGSYEDVHIHSPWEVEMLQRWGMTRPPGVSVMDLTVVDRLGAGSIRWRPANHAHTVRTTGAWTVLWTQPKRRYFGFFTNRPGGRVKWLKANRYFLTYGHPPCAD